MNKEIIKYEPLLEVITWEDKRYYTPLKNFAELQKMMNSDKFIQIGVSTIAVSSIKEVTPAISEVNLIEAEINKLPYDIRNKVKLRIAEYQKEFPFKDITPGILSNIIEKYGTT